MAPEPEVDDSETFEAPITLDDIERAVKMVDEPVFPSSDIAEIVGLSRESTRQKLTRLYDQGRIERRKHGNMLMWWNPPLIEAETPPERLLELLSEKLGEKIIVDGTVYEHGEQHPLSDEQTETVESAVEEVLSDE